MQSCQSSRSLPVRATAFVSGVISTTTRTWTRILALARSSIKSSSMKLALVSIIVIPLDWHDHSLASSPGYQTDRDGSHLLYLRDGAVERRLADGNGDVDATSNVAEIVSTEESAQMVRHVTRTDLLKLTVDPLSQVHSAQLRGRSVLGP